MAENALTRRVSKLARISCLSGGLLALLGCQICPEPGLPPAWPDCPECPKPQPPSSKGILMPRIIPAHTPVVIVVCDKVSDIEVYADEHRLGYLGDNFASGCKQLVQPGFNQLGDRLITVGEFSAVLSVF